MAHDLFISYSTQDKAIADRLVHELEAKGVRCWIAPRDVAYGSDWQQSILDAIAAAKALVLVFSAGANTSSTVRKEVLAAVESNVLVIPFRVEDVRPQGALRFNLIDVHWLDAVTPPLDPHIDLLVDRVSRLTEDIEPESGPPVDPEPQPTPPKRRRRKAADAAPVSTVEPEAETVEPAERRPPPDPTPAPPPPPPGPQPPPVLTDDEKQRRQNLIIVGAVALAVIVVLLLAFCRPKPEPDPPSYLSSNSTSDTSSSGSTDSSSSSAQSGSVSDISSLSSPDDKNRYVEIVNQTGKPMVGLYASAPASSWGANRMSGTLASGASYRFNLSDGTEECYLDVKGVFDDATYSSTPRFHVCGQSTLTFTTTVAPS